MKTDDKVYLSNGKIAFYEEHVKSGILVYYWNEITDFIGAERFADAYKSYEVVDVVFTSPPVEQYDESIKKKQEKINELIKYIKDLEQDKQRDNREYLELIKKLKSIEVLRHIDKMLDGNSVLDHFVRKDYTGYSIVSTDPRCVPSFGSSSYEPKMRMIVLIMDKYKKLSWQMNEYYDGSGRNDIVYPCDSYEDAVEFLKKKVLEDSELQLTEYTHYGMGGLITCSEEYNIKLPNELLIKYYTENIEANVKPINNSKDIYHRHLDITKTNEDKLALIVDEKLYYE